MDNFQIVDTIAPPGSKSRTELITHLLKAEGLPSVEDFEDLSLIKLTSENRKRWLGDKDDEIANLRRELDEAKQKLRIWFNGDGSTGTAKSPTQVMEDRRAAAIHLDQLKVENWELKEKLSETRQSRLEELLEAEAAERVESADGLAGHRWFRVGNVCTPQVVAEKNEVSVRLHDDRLNYDEAADFILCLAAALAEKRRREADRE